MLGKNFFEIRVKDSVKVFELIEKSKSENIPLVFALNHPNWWDAATVIWLGYDYLKTGGYCIMEEKQIKEHPFFLKIGAIPIVREDFRKSLRSLNFAISVLKQGYESLFIFPQGELTPNEKRDSKFYPGVSYITGKLKKVNLVYVFLDYKFTSEQKPVIFIEFFKSDEFHSEMKIDRNEFTETMRENFNKVNDEFLYAYINNYTDSYKVALRGKISQDKKKLF